MEDSPYRESGLGAGEAPVCLFCGSERDANADHCEKCGVSCAPPAANDDAASSFACPRCGNFLALASFGRATIKSCKKCHGVFLPALQFSIIVHDYMNGMELPVGDTLLPLPPGQEIDRIAPVMCIGCGKEMDRVNFASRSDAIIDVCIVHGIWLDPPELIPMLHFVKTRAELGEVPLTDAEKQDQIELAKERDESMQRMQFADLARKMIRRSMGRYR
jgi:Zn-finger nucleic acid-binding protein